MEDYKKLLTDLYTTNDPERVKQIDYFLERYKGKEKQFYTSQKAKYESKKPVSDSKKIIEEALARIKSQSDDKAKKDIAEKQKEEPDKEKEIVVEETRKEIKAVAPPPKDAIKKDIWFEEKTKKAATSPKPPQSDPHPFKTDKHFNKKYFLYIFGSVLLVIILAVILFFILFYSPKTKKETTTAKKPKTTITKKTVKAEPKKTTTTAAKPTENKVTTITPKPAAKPSPPKQSSSISNGTYIKKGSITLPAYFVACSAVKKESLAIKKVNELKSKGFEASYYWIPDFVAHGNPYFKVVIGPFSARMDAMKKLTPVQERAEFDAYVLELK